MNQLENVGLFCLLARGLDDKIHGPAIGQKTQAPGIPLIEANLIEQGIGLAEVESCPAEPMLPLVEGALRQDRIVSFNGEAIIKHLVNFVPVDGLG